jgi:hypothetical protein
MVTVTVVGPASMTGADIRPVAGVPLEQARSQTRTCSSVVVGPGPGNAGSSAQVAGPNPGGIVPLTAGGSGSGDTGHVAPGPGALLPMPQADAATPISRTAHATRQLTQRS